MGVVADWVRMMDSDGNGLRPRMLVFRVLEDFCQEDFESMKFEFEVVGELVERE